MVLVRSARLAWTLRITRSLERATTYQLFWHAARRGDVTGECGMSVPDYESLMRPVLDAVADGQATHIRDLRARIASALSLGEEALALTIPSGSRLFDSRVHWAVTYLAQAGVVRRPRRGYVELSSRGREMLESNLARVDNSQLSHYPEFVDFQTRARGGRSSTAGSSDLVRNSAGLPGASGVTPREQLSISVEEANAAVATEVLERVLTQSPEFLERLVLRLLTAMGYGGREGAAEHLGRSGDQGLDGVIRQDALGLDRVYIQAKRCVRTCGWPTRHPSVRWRATRRAGGSWRVHHHEQVHA